MTEELTYSHSICVSPTLQLNTQNSHIGIHLSVSAGVYGDNLADLCAIKHGLTEHSAGILIKQSFLCCLLFAEC